MSRTDGKYVIGLTGNIATGKSVVRQMLQHLGAYTIDADGLTHQAMAPGAPAYQPIIDMFGKFVVNEDGTINRNTLGSIAFSFPDALAKLEAIVHPVVTSAIGTLVSRAKQPVIVIEAIKLLESDLARMINDVWVVDAAAESQMKRLTEKRKMSEEEARKRVLAQRPQADKIARASFIVMNDGSVEDTWKQVQTGWNDVRRAALGGTGALPPADATLARPPATPAGVASTQPAKPRTGMLSQLQTTAGAPPAATVQPLRPPIQPLPGQAAAPTAASLHVEIRRGMPGNAEAIARFKTRVTGKPVERMEVMLAFGQKSYLIAMDGHENILGITGWQVENLITRVDEFHTDNSLEREPVVRALTNAIEDASRELQSEVSFIFLPPNTQVEIIQSFLTEGYNFLRLEEVKFPAWREAASEMLSNDGQALMKQLRADRVMKPI